MPSLSTYCLTGVSLTLDVGISSWLLQQSTAAAPYLGRVVSPHMGYLLPIGISNEIYSQQKQEQELTVARIMNSLLPNSELN